MGRNGERIKTKRFEVPLIEIRGLSHKYNAGTPHEVRSLDCVDLVVYPGETVGIIGPNGSGKSTLLLHMNGLVRPQQGEVRFGGVSLTDPGIDLKKIRVKVGLVFQNPEDQLFERFAGDDVAFGPRNLGLPLDEVRERVRAAMEMVGLPFTDKDRLTMELSRGEKRRVALAGVLAMEPRALVLDEPTANLDPSGRRELRAVFRRWRAGGRSIVMVSHNIEDIAELAGRIYVLVGGRIVLEGAASEVLVRRHELRDAGLPVPFSVELIHELRKRGFSISDRAVTLSEAVKEIGGLFHG